MFLLSRNVLLTDIHLTGSERTAQLDLIVPLQKVFKSNITPVGMIIMSLDPGKILYPVVKSWPIQSRTSEILLLKREGDSIVYLNELRHLQGRPLSVKRSVSDNNLLGVRAIRGFTGVVEGVDYRNIKVLGALKKIAGSGWYMVAKVDMKEIKRPGAKRDFAHFPSAGFCNFSFWSCYWLDNLASEGKILPSEGMRTSWNRWHSGHISTFS